jgi:hypothetical protein
VGSDFSSSGESKRSLAKTGAVRVSAKAVASAATGVLTVATQSQRRKPSLMWILPRAYVWHQQLMEALVSMSTMVEGPQRRGRLRRFPRTDAGPSASPEAVEVATVRRKCLGSFCSPPWVTL